MALAAAGSGIAAGATRSGVAGMAGVADGRVVRVATGGGGAPGNGDGWAVPPDEAQPLAIKQPLAINRRPGSEGERTTEMGRGNTLVVLSAHVSIRPPEASTKAVMSSR